VLSYKRLECAKFRMPKVQLGTGTATLDATALAMLVDGFDVKYVRRLVLWQPPGVGCMDAG
jgi:hypothetical protein